MFKALGNFLHKTPWWALVVLGFSTLLLLALFTAPFELIRLSESGDTPEQQRAIKREIDHAFGDTALGAAEQVVKAMRARAQDPSRKIELDQALRDIAEARREIFSAQRNANQSVKEAMRAAADAALQAAREAAQTTREAAQERIVALKEARQDAVAAQKKAGIDEASGLSAFDSLIVEAELNEKAAGDALERINSKKFAQDLEADFGLKSPAEVKSNADKDAGKVAPPAINKSPSASKVPAIPAPDDASPPASGATTPAPKGLKPEGRPRERDFKGDLSFGRTGDNGKGTDQDRNHGKASGDDRRIIKLDRLGGMTFDAQGNALAQPKLTPLAPELRDDIREKVRADFRRIGIGSALILTFIPLFIMLLVAKFLIDRSRRAQAFAEIKMQEADSANLNRQIVEARLQALQAQVEPHFLYNTLANVQALTEVDPPQANKMVGHLIQYLRATLPKMRETTSTVGQEVELVCAYLNILKMRMGERLAFDIAVPAGLESMPFPPLMLPSLVENAIKHGLEPLREGGRIDVIAEKVGGHIRLVVKDTGRGLTEEPMLAGGGIGLSNIRERLQALFGDSAKLTLESNTPKGMIATITVPAAAIANFARAASVSGNHQLELPKPVDTAPNGFAARTWWVARKTHGVWLRVLTVTLIGAMILLGVILLLGLTSVATGIMPLQFGDIQLAGLEGMALGSLLLVLAFFALALVAVVLTVVIYGLGMLFAGLLVIVPLMILVSLFPVLAPFVLFGLLVWWLIRRTKAKNAARDSLN